MLIANIYNSNAHIHNMVDRRSATEVVRRGTVHVEVMAHLNHI